MKNVDLALEKIQEAMKTAARLSAIRELPLYLMSDEGKILPGIHEGSGQILTRSELNALPEMEALQYRMIFVARYAMKDQRSSRKTA